MGPSVEGFIAVNRFGLGARPGELAEASADPRAWLGAQLSAGAELPAELAGLPTSSAVIEATQELRAATPGRARLAGKNRDGAALPPAAEDMDPTPAKIPTNEEVSRGAARDAQFAELGKRSRELYMKEAAARTLAQVASRQPLRERLTAFWSNHFTVSVIRPIVLGLAGAFEREAIRPHVTGRFHDLLLAVVRHPAMLLYLDNAGSVGPHSRLGRLKSRGLNENLARELLELHTLGVDGGYTQADVTAFAGILTGWSIGGQKDRQPGTFKFRPGLHEPGEKIFLAERFGPAGEEEGLRALDLLARHPSTARHIAHQFTTHFIADEPSDALVERFANVFRESEGDLGALTNAAIDAPEVWAKPLAKLKTPNELVVSTLRATGFGGDSKRLLGALRGLGQAPFAAPSPAGWPDKAAGWMGPSAVLERADFADAVAKRIAGRISPGQLLASTIGPVGDANLSQAVARAAGIDDANALILASPQFQRR
jgi:uncharacterized protein (DUF1800 family)